MNTIRSLTLETYESERFDELEIPDGVVEIDGDLWSGKRSWHYEGPAQSIRQLADMAGAVGFEVDVGNTRAATTVVDCCAHKCGHEWALPRRSPISR